MLRKVNSRQKKIPTSDAGTENVHGIIKALNHVANITFFQLLTVKKDSISKYLTLVKWMNNNNLIKDFYFGYVHGIIIILKSH